MEGGIPQGIEERWEEYAVYTGPSRGLVNCPGERSGTLDGKMLELSVLWMTKGSLGRWMSGLGLLGMSQKG
eukprot:11680287-Heterocapsa_arctica.AAC.1